MVADSCQLQRDFAPPKGGERPALSPGWRRTKLRLAAGRLLVALGRVRVLFLCAKHLFVAARRGHATMPLRFSSLRRGLLLVAVNHEKGEPHKYSKVGVWPRVTNSGVRSERRSMGNVRASWRERPPISVASLQSSSERGVQAATADPLGW